MITRTGRPHPGRASALGLVALAALWAAPPVAAAENEHGLVYAVWFVPPGPDDPEAPPLTVQDQVRYCGAAEEWSRRIWEATDGSHQIYQVHFFHGYDEQPGATEVFWFRWPGVSNATGCNNCFRMFDAPKGCSKDYAFEGGELVSTLACTGEGEVCSLTDGDDLRESVCLLDGEPVSVPTAEIGWVAAHENLHSHYRLFDEYVPDASAAGFRTYHVCVGEEGNAGTEQTSMMAKRLRNHLCDIETHVSERPVRNLAGEIVLDDEGQPIMAQNPSHPGGAWADALDSNDHWYLHPLEYSGNYDNVPDYPGLPIPHFETGNPVTFCVWHTQGDGQPVNDVLLLLDKSGSMGFRHPAFEDGPTALEGAAQSAWRFYQGLRDDRLGGIFAFDTDIDELIPYGPKDDDAEPPDVSHGGNTDLCRAIREGADAIKAEGPTPDFGGGQQILLSDGRPTVQGCNSDADVLQAAMDACSGGLEGVGVATNTIAFGDADRELLRQVADVCGAQTTALLVPSTDIPDLAAGSTPLQVRTTLSRSGRFARGYHEVLQRDATTAPQRDDLFVVPPGSAELSVEWMGDGFQYTFLSDQNVIDCRFATMNFALVGPGGEVFDDGEVSGETHVIRVDGPAPGAWRARLTLDDENFCHPAHAGSHVWGDYDPRIAVVASVRAAWIVSDMAVSPTVAPRDAPVTVTAHVDLSGTARVTGMTVAATVTDPSGSSIDLSLVDNGAEGDAEAGDGIYTGIFNPDGAEMIPGGYRVAVQATVQAGVTGTVPLWDAAVEQAGGTLPSAPDLSISLEDSFVYRDCEAGAGSIGGTCGDRFAIPTVPEGDGCATRLPPGTARAGIELETRGIPLGERFVGVSGGVGVRVRNVETLSYDPESRVGRIRFDAEATPAAPDEVRHFRVSFAGQSVRTQDCRPELEPRWEYTAKLVCGAQRDTRSMQFARGFYATTVNVRNPGRRDATVRKSLSLAIPPGRQRPGKVLPVAIDRLPPGQSLAVDCDDILARAFDGQMPGPVIDGYVVLRSDRRLVVSGVYTTATLNAEGTAEDHSSMHIEPAVERRLEQPDADPRRADLVIDDDLSTDTVCRGRRCQVSIRFTVRNIGAGAAVPFEVDIVRSETNASLATVPVAAGLEPAAGFVDTVHVNYLLREEDPRRICIRADGPMNAVEETDETNNDRCFGF